MNGILTNHRSNRLGMVDKPFNFNETFIHSFIQAISLAPLQIHYYSEALPTQQGCCARVSRWSEANLAKH